MGVSEFPTTPFQGDHQRRLQKGGSDGNYGVRHSGISLFLLFCCLETFILRLVLVREDVGTHKVHVVHYVHTSLPEVADKDIGFLVSDLNGWSLPFYMAQYG